MLPFFFKKWDEAQNWVRTAALLAIKGSLLSRSPLDLGIKILCVDDDQSFCHFMQRLAYSMGIQLDAVHSIEEAKHAIEEWHDYRSFIIDGHLPDGSGFELVAWIREKHAMSQPIGFISRIYQDAKSFRVLKEKLKVDFVLDKPIRPVEAHQLLMQLCRLEKMSALHDPFSSELLAELKTTYQKSIADKVERLERMILAVEKNPVLGNLQALRGEVHKIAGSAGSYGYMAVSELCKKLELELISQIDWAKKAQINPQWLLSLDEFFTQIKLHFQMEFPEEEMQEGSQTRQLPSLYIVDNDEVLLKQFAKLSVTHQFAILTEMRPDKALQTLLSEDFYPQIFLLNSRYGSSVLTGHEILKAYYRKYDYLTTAIGLMVNRGAWDKLIEALQNGMLFIAEKPLNLPMVFHLLDQAPFRALPFHYKVLVIDEDVDSCEYILQTLKYAGLEATALQDFHTIPRQLKRVHPDVIFLDINLVDESGIKLLESLRKMTKYKNLIVGMLTVTPDDLFSLQKCFDAGVDEIIFKPLDRGVLQRKIAGLLKKKANETMGASQDSIMGMEGMHTLKTYLNALQQQFLPPFPKILVMIEVQGFALLSQQTKKKVLALLSQSLEDLLRKYELVSYLGEGKFALIFQGYDPHFVQLFVRTCFDRWPDQLLKIKHQKIHLNESLVILSAEKSADDHLKKGEELLQLARHLSDSYLRMVMEPTFISLKEVIIFHDNGQPPEGLTDLFKKHEFKVTLKTTALADQVFSVIPMPLLILTGSFADVACLPLIKKWSMENQVQIPLVLLSHWPADEDLLRLLKEVNYFEAPFSLVILINKAAR